MTARARPDDGVRAAVADALRPFRGAPAVGAGGVVLAVSGGRDSMVLLHAAAAVAADAVRAVATFDHGTSAHATRAADLVRAVGAALGVPVVGGAAAQVGRTEAEWREARWNFLRAVVADLGGNAVATAHTRDDQLETVATRVLRGAGARGTAALAARTPAVVRPLVTLTRARVAEYAATRGVRWVDDPSNEDRAHLRVRLRADLLPAIARARPDAGARLLALAADAARWRDDADAWAAGVCAHHDPSGVNVPSQTVVPEIETARVPVSALAHCDAAALAVFWPAFAARAGVRLDRRAIARLVTYTAQVVGRVRDGTVQPAHIPVAAAAGRAAQGAIALVHAADPAGPAGRVWQFVVRLVMRPPTGVGVAGPRSSDYA